MIILCIIDSLGSGGAQRQLVLLAKGFKEKGHDVSFLIYHNADFYKGELEDAGIPIKFINETNYMLRLIKMRRFIRKGRYDAVLSFLEAANFIATVSGFPYRKWNLVVGERSANPNILKSFKLRFYRWFHLFADFVVANSQTNLDIVQKANPLLGKNKCRVIYNLTYGIGYEKGGNCVQNEKITITIPASYRKVKNLDGLIEGINLLSDGYKMKLSVNWYGNKDIEDNIAYIDAYNKIEEYKLEDVIRLHDVTNNIFREYLNTDFVALLSHYEGFPNVVVEGMTLGKPIIASKISDLPLIITEGVNGFLCDSKEVTSIKSALEKAIDTTIEERQEMGKNNIQKSNKLFNNEDIIKSYLNLLGGVSPK